MNTQSSKRGGLGFRASGLGFRVFTSYPRIEACWTATRSPLRAARASQPSGALLPFFWFLGSLIKLPSPKRAITLTRIQKLVAQRYPVALSGN